MGTKPPIANNSWLQIQALKETVKQLNYIEETHYQILSNVEMRVLKEVYIKALFYLGKKKIKKLISYKIYSKKLKTKIHSKNKQKGRRK